MAHLHEPSRLGALLLICGIVLIPGAPTARAQESAKIDTEAGEVFRSVMSPFCPGRTLDNCPSPQAAVLRDSIRQWLSEELSKDSVMRRLYDMYGDEVRSVPPLEGWGIVGWLMPPVIIVVGALIMVVWLRARRRTQDDTEYAQSSGALDDADEERLRRELEDLGV